MKLIIDFLLVTGIVVTIFILFSLLRNKQKKTLPDKILIIIFIILFFIVLGFYSILHDLDILLYISFLPYYVTGYLLGPLFYLYIKSLYYSEIDFFKKNKWHFLPCLLILLFWQVPLLISYLQGEFLFSYLRTIENNDWDNIETVFQALFFITYCGLSLYQLVTYRKVAKHNFSNLLEKDLNWIQYLIMGCLIAMSIDVVIFSYQWMFGKFAADFDMGYLTIFPLMLMIIYLGYHGLTQSRILLPAFMLEESPPVYTVEKHTSKAIHHLSNATDGEIEELTTTLQTILDQSKPYLQEDLTLGSLAALIPTTDRKLSALLNHYLHISFYDLINQYRVKEVKAKIADPKYNHFTLLAIGYECGFKSKTSFNRIFKKETGLSPSKYKASLVAN